MRRPLLLEQLETRRVLTALVMSEDEQVLLELINRARQAPAEEAQRFGIDLNEGLPPGTLTPNPKPPLAPNEALNVAAGWHSQDMFDRDFFDHVNPSGQNPRDRMREVDYEPRAWGENIAFDYAVESAHRGLFHSPGHRENILWTGVREVGIGIRYGDSFGFSGMMVTEKFGLQRGEDPFLTGVVYSDNRRGDQFYTRGEGLSEVVVSAIRHEDGKTFSTTTGPTGVYSMAIPSGTYEFVAQGGELPQPIRHSNQPMYTTNRKVDFIVPFGPPPQDRFELNNVEADAYDLGVGDLDLNGFTIHDSDDEDFFLWSSIGDGTLDVDLEFVHAEGDLELVVENLTSDERYYGNSLTDNESLDIPVKQGDMLRLHVYEYHEYVQRGYRLRLDGPGGVAPKADFAESNDVSDEERGLSGGDQILTSLTIHDPRDVDRFQWSPLADGPFRFSIDSDSDQLQIELFDSEGNLIDSSDGQDPSVGMDDGAAEESYSVVIKPVSFTIVDRYDLALDAITPPIAVTDVYWVAQGATVELPLLGNDVDLDGEIQPSTLQTSGTPDGTLAISDGRVTYTAPTDYNGVDRFQYRVADEDGAFSNWAHVQIVSRPPSDTPWHNESFVYDVDWDGNATATDLLQIVNALNLLGTIDLDEPTLHHAPLFAWDVNADKLLSPIDALLVVNYLNSRV